MLRVGIALTNLGYNLRDLSWGVPLISELTIIPIEFCQLSEVNVRAETFLDGLAIKDIGIGRKLNPACRALVQITNERLRVLARRFPTRNVGTSFVSASNATKIHASPSSTESSLRTRFAFFPTNVHISSHWTRRQGNSRMAVSMRVEQRSPTETKSRMIVSRWIPVMRSMLRILLPSVRAVTTVTFSCIESVYISACLSAGLSR